MPYEWIRPDELKGDGIKNTVSFMKNLLQEQYPNSQISFKGIKKEYKLPTVDEAILSIGELHGK